MSLLLTKELVGTAVALAISLGSIPLIKCVGQSLGITASPAIDRSLRPKIPATGGMAIIIAILAGLAASVSLSWIAVGAIGLFVVGFIDDATVLAPRHKLACQLAILSCAAIYLLPENKFTPWPIVNLTTTIFWLTATTNAFNLIDGLDGLAGGVGIVAAAAITFVGFTYGSQPVAVTGLVICASLAGFLVYNFPPASIIMGDAGALPLGYLLGALALESGRLATNSYLTIWVFPVLVMLVPLLDTAIVMVTRTTTGKSIAWRGLDHVHDRLLALGLAARQVAITAWLIASVSAACAIAVSRLRDENLLIALPFIALTATVIALFTIDLTFDGIAPAEAYGSVRGLARLVLSLSYKRRLAEAAMDLILIAAAYCGAVALRLDFSLSPQVMRSIGTGLPWVVALTYPAFLAAGVYRGIWRHFGLGDLARLMFGGALAGLLVTLGSYFLPIRHSGSIAVLYAILLGNLLVATRSSFALLRKFINSLATVADRILVIGAGAAGAMAANFVLQTRSRSAQLVGFVDGDSFRMGKLVEGWRVLGAPEELEQIYARVPFTEILVADENLTAEQLLEVVRFGKERGMPIRSFTIQMKEVDAVKGMTAIALRAA